MYVLSTQLQFYPYVEVRFVRIKQTFHSFNLHIGLREIFEMTQMKFSAILIPWDISRYNG